jgi:hypothetical protein
MSLSRFQKGDHVVTPAANTARVIGAVQGRIVPLRYDDPLDPADALVDLDERLLRKYVPGLKMPKPVRIR